MSGLVVPLRSGTVIKDDRCERCKHSAPSQQGQLGQLEGRRFPPTLIVPTPGQILSAFALTSPDASCGEFSKRIVLDS